MRLLAIAVVSLLLAATIAAGQSTTGAGQFEGRPIVSLTITGLKHIKEDVVVRQILSQPGRPYSQETIGADVLRLERLRVFSNIDISPTPSEDGVRVEVRVVETFRILPAVSIGVSDESGTSIGPAIKVLSFKGQPHEMSFTYRFGGEQLAEFTENSPYLTGQTLWHSTRLSLRDRQNGLDDFSEHSVDFDARVGARLSATVKVGAIGQLYTVKSEQSGYTLDSDNRDQFTGVGAIIEHDSRDSWTTPRRGWWNSMDVIWHVGTGDYATVDFDARRFQPLTARQTIVATTLLTLQPGQRGVDIPTYSDFALGGANTVRGWGFESRRGKNQFIASLEHRYTLVPTRGFRVKGLNVYGGVALAVFGDVGTVWNAEHEFADNAIGGFGVGLRVFVPFIDVLRIDLAFGDGTRGAIGINEKAFAQRNRVR